MECPKCGYMLDPFEASCPRCARQHTPGATAVQPEPSPQHAEVLKTLDALEPRLQQRAARQPAPIRYAPTLGWPLTIALWLLIAYHGLLFGAVVLLAVGIQAMNPGDKHVGVPLLVFFGTFPGMNLAGAIGMLRCQRWGFYLFMVFTVGPLSLLLLLGAHFNWFGLFGICFSALVFLLVLGKFNELE